uniref:PPPDE domain-containing protein n=1 Tax=viral metagenome TaxID=1070528 RepID=A0A6C0F7L3_9ZZZZ|tara:strand:- start:6294 stop:6650 length:357 start_codon:yes stop_codon:yes gene_type:complete
MHVLLHIEKIFKFLPIYHVGVTYQYGPFKRRFDFHPKRLNIPIQGQRKTLNLGRSKRNPLQILHHEKQIKKNYFLTQNDCRHYTDDLLNYSLDSPPDVINLSSLHSIYSTIDSNDIFT